MWSSGSVRQIWVTRFPNIDEGEPGCCELCGFREGMLEKAIIDGKRQTVTGMDFETKTATPTLRAWNSLVWPIISV
jgi:hypothetical protein